jgi:hypothetical protein
MTLQFTLEASSGVPAGAYGARFLGIEDVPANEYGASIRWNFEIASGQYEGRKTGCLTPPKLTAINKTGKIIGGLLGGSLPKEGEKIELSSCVGKTYFVVVAKAKSSDATVVESVSLPPV